MDMQKVRKFMKPLQTGVLSEPTFPDKRDQAIEEDYQKLWKKAKDMVSARALLVRVYLVIN